MNVRYECNPPILPSIPGPFRPSPRLCQELRRKLHQTPRHELTFWLRTYVARLGIHIKAVRSAFNISTLCASKPSMFHSIIPQSGAQISFFFFWRAVNKFCYSHAKSGPRLLCPVEFAPIRLADLADASPTELDMHDCHPSFLDTALGHLLCYCSRPSYPSDAARLPLFVFFGVVILAA